MLKPPIPIFAQNAVTAHRVAYIISIIIFSMTWNGCGVPTPNTQQSTDVQGIQLSTSEQDTGWEWLFDGTSTSQWRGYNQNIFPEEGWVVEDEQLVIRKREKKTSNWGGDIITKRQYGDFELSLEVMLTDSANSGVLYRVIENPGHEIWHFAPEYQILDNETWSKIMPEDQLASHKMGECYDLFEGERDYSKPLGQWNLIRILCIGNHVEHWLNGQMVISYNINSNRWNQRVKQSKFKDYAQFSQSPQGHIGLQDYDHEVRFRNIKIRIINE